jgi:predicted MFS family arabinose efflux permease
MAGYFARSTPAARGIPADQAELASGARRQRRCLVGTIDPVNDSGHVFQRSHKIRPIGVAAALAAVVVLPSAARQPGRFDLPGAVTGTGGVVALVYGLSSATTSPDGTSHWGDSQVVAALSAAAVLLTAFAVIEARTRHALLPTRLLRNRNRLGAYLIMLGVGTAVFGVFFFITLFVQDVWGYSALRTGVAFLPLTVALLAASGAATSLVQRIGAWPLLLIGSAASAGGLYWLSRVTEHSTYAGGLLGPTLLTGAGLGLLFVPLPLVALARVADADSGSPPACSTLAGK